MYHNHRLLGAEGNNAHWHCKGLLFAALAANFGVISSSEFQAYPNLLDKYENVFPHVLGYEIWGRKKPCLKYFLSYSLFFCTMELTDGKVQQWKYKDRKRRMSIRNREVGKDVDECNQFIK